MQSVTRVGRRKARRVSAGRVGSIYSSERASRLFAAPLRNHQQHEHTGTCSPFSHPPGAFSPPRFRDARRRETQDGRPREDGRAMGRESPLFSAGTGSYSILRRESHLLVCSGVAELEMGSTRLILVATLRARREGTCFAIFAMQIRPEGGCLFRSGITPLSCPFPGA